MIPSLHDKENNVKVTGEIDRSSPIPYYFQLQEVLQNWIEENHISPHTQVPSEAELCERFGVSRTVVRQALLGLERDGLIYRIKGRGSFIAPPKLRQQITELTSFTQDARQRGARPGSRVLRQEMCPASEAIAKRLQIPPQTLILLLERVRFVNGEPLALETVHLSFDGCEGLLEEDFENQSLYEVLATRYGITPFQAEQEHEASIVRPREVKLLDLQPGDPVMYVSRVTYDTDQHPFEVTRCVYRGDKYRFVALLRKA
jgi:GntR family transcriptional regulator